LKMFIDVLTHCKLDHIFFDFKESQIE